MYNEFNGFYYEVGVLLAIDFLMTNASFNEVDKP